MAPASTRAAAALDDVTLDNTDALDCGLCCLPLKPPIFQCKVGHVVCSPCRDKLGAARRCHVCRTATSGGYHRNHDMEKLLESIRVPCSNAAYGCAAKPVYYDRDIHLRSCQHAPCHCPLKACGFAGSTSALMDHFAAVHTWPSTTELRSWRPVQVHLREGFNVTSLRTDRQHYLFLITVARKQFGTAISVFCVHPQAPVVDGEPPPTPRTVGFEVRLKYSRRNYCSGDMCRGHNQETKFKVAFTDLSNGLPDSDDACHFFLPKFVHPFDIETITAEFDVGTVRMDAFSSSYTLS
ncbi:hypothetical protein ACQ4PT_047013 [Festuca glaucescens]